MRHHRVHWLVLCLVMVTLAGSAGCPDNGNGGNGNGSSVATAIELLQKKEAAEEIEDPVARNKALLRVADDYLKTDDKLATTNCINAAEEAAKKIRSSKQPGARANAYAELAKRWQKVGDIDKCRKARLIRHDTVSGTHRLGPCGGHRVEIARLVPWVRSRAPHLTRRNAGTLRPSFPLWDCRWRPNTENRSGNHHDNDSGKLRKMR